MKYNFTYVIGLLLTLRFFDYDLLLMENAAISTGTTFWTLFAHLGLEAFMFIAKQKGNRRN